MTAGDDAVPRKPSVLPLFVMPVVIFASVFLSIEAPGFIADILDYIVPWLITIWIGMGFAFTWDTVRFSMRQQGLPPIVLAGTGVLAALILLSMLGVETLWDDPWLFGVAVWPGLTMARPWIESLASSWLRRSAASQD